VTSRSSSPRRGSGTGWEGAGARLGEALVRPLVIRPEGDAPHHDESRVHLLTTASLRALGGLLGGPVDVALPSERRPRGSGEGFAEDEWVGRELALGDDAVLRLGPGMPRCVMAGLPQGDLQKDKQILRTLAEERDLSFGLQASIVCGGTVRVGDGAVLL
jgi:hypothetical protein